MWQMILKSMEIKLFSIQIQIRPRQFLKYFPNI